MRSRLAAGGALLLATVVVSACRLHGQASQSSGPELEIFPKHFLLRPGEQIHYQVRLREGDHSQSVPRYEFAIDDSEIVRPMEPNGDLFIEAVRSGRTHVLVRTPTSERRFTIEVAGPARPRMMAVPHSAVSEIRAKEFPGEARS